MIKLIQTEFLWWFTQESCSKITDCYANNSDLPYNVVLFESNDCYPLCINNSSTIWNLDQDEFILREFSDM